MRHVNAKQIKFDRPLYVNGLRVFPNRFEYGNQVKHFGEIKHITLAKVTDDSAYHGQPEIQVICDDTKAFTFGYRVKQDEQKLLVAYDYLSTKSYKKRLNQYLTQLEHNGCIDYLGCKIQANGELTLHNKQYHIEELDVKLGKANFNQQTLIGETGTIHLTKDKDVMVSLIEHILDHGSQASAKQTANVSKAPPQAPTERQLLMQLVAAIFSLFTKQHIKIEKYAADYFKRFLIAHFKPAKNELIMAFHHVEEVRHAPLSFAHYLNEFTQATSTQRNLRRHLIDMLVNIACHTGIVSDAHRLFITKAESITGLKSSQYAEYKTSSRETIKQRASAQIPQHALTIFGLNSGFTEAELKRAYRRLVIKFHPDRLHHLGEQVVGEAESRMKAINKAYSLLLKSLKQPQKAE